MDMDSKILLLPHEYGPDSQIIWREAIRRGWHTERIGKSRTDIERKLLGYNYFRYYGNLLNLMETQEYLPIKFLPIDVSNVTKLERFTKRRVELVAAKNVTLPINGKKFYKCVGIKWIESRVYNVGESFHAKPDDLLYKQDIVNVKDEIRCFVKNGEILTASWYRINKEFNPQELTDTSFLSELQNFTTQIWAAAVWPNGVVFDFGIMDNGDICFIEANEAYCSGTYDCRPSDIFDTIIASQQ